MKTTCPFCRITHDAITPAGDPSEPEAGNASICVDCGMIGVFESSTAVLKTADLPDQTLIVLRVRKPTAEELKELDESLIVQVIRRRWLDQKRAKGSRLN